jgi:hypothetical protein
MLRFISVGVCLFFLMTLRATAEEVATSAVEKMVARAQFTTQIVNREPVDDIAVVSPPVDAVFFFTDLRHMEGHTVFHRWEYNGQLISQKSFNVEGPRWRVFSKIVLEPGNYGEWSVTVLDETGWPWHVELFRYDPPVGNSRRPVVQFQPSE